MNAKKLQESLKKPRPPIPTDFVRIVREVMGSKEKSFNFTIARPWKEDDGALCCYRVDNIDIHHGTVSDAKSLLKYVEKQSKEKYRIYTLKELLK